MISKNFEYATKELICSASGWRKKFLLTNNYLQDYDALFFYYAIQSFIYLQEKEQARLMHNTGNSHNITALTFAVALDTRAASKELATIAMYAVQQYQSTATQRSVRHSSQMLGIVPIPAALAYTSVHADALIFITASHNPKEYSGIKFCQGNGQVLVPEKNKKLVSLCMNTAKKALHNTIRNEQKELLSLIRSNLVTTEYKKTDHTLSTTPTDATSDTMNMHTIHTMITKEYATVLEKAVLRNSSHQSYAHIQKLFIQKIKAYKKNVQIHPALIWDVNGGARCWKGDTTIFKQYRIPVQRINTKPGVFTHEIVPEGTALEQASYTLHAYNTKRATSSIRNKNMYLFAMVSDCDGDRGNTILYDFEKQSCHTLSAQEIFALILTIELAWERFIQNNSASDTNSNTIAQKKHAQQKLAIVINDASSVRIDAIAQQYSVPVFRSEVGEANIVSLALELRKKNFTIPVSGEASNGGIIMHPSFVRDPLHTSFSLLKAVLFFEELFPHLNASKVPHKTGHINNTINPLILLARSLPKSASTSTEDALAKLTIPTISMSQVFYRIIHNSKPLIKTISTLFKNKGIALDSHAFIAHSGKKHTVIQTDTLTENNTLNGGLSLYFYAKQHSPIAMLWLRKSATEPVVRIIADVVGSHAVSLERALLKLWRTYIVSILT